MSWQAKGGGRWSGGGGGHGGGGSSALQGLSTGFTPLGFKLAVGVFVCLLLEMLARHQLGLNSWVEELVLVPVNAPTWRPWQLVTHPFVGAYAPVPFDGFRFFFTLLGLYFFAAPAERYFGTGRFITFLLVLVVGSGLVGSLLSYFVVPKAGGIPVAPVLFRYGGIEVIVISCLCTFCWTHRGATILLMFILPIPAMYILYLTVGAEVLGVAMGLHYSVYHLAGIGITYAVVQRGVQLPDAKRRWLLLKEKRIKKKLSKFDVIDGGKSDGPFAGGGRSRGPSNGHGDDEPPKPLLH